MLELKGTSLPKRQQELNKNVKEAVIKKVNFEEIRVLEEKSDVDRLFKIDVASEYRDVGYILETFTSGDSLYISRALKCLWIYGDKYSSVINPEYLDKNIFSLMSIKMKTKMLTAISMNIKNQERVESFYKYCIDNKLENAAFKFLKFTSETNKLEFLNKRGLNSIENAKNFIGNSFPLAKAYLQLHADYRKPHVMHELRFLYSISSEQYLDLLESQDAPQIFHGFNSGGYTLGLRISKDIIIKHKKRVLHKPKLYLAHLNIHMVVKHSTVEDAKVYFAALLPQDDFWSYNFCEAYRKILNILPQNEIIPFVKQLFEAKYPGKPFESCKQFYIYKLHELLTPEQREAWALEQLKQNPELLGPDTNFLWYQFVNFDIAFKEIKKYIHITTNHSKRVKMLNILVDSAKTEEALVKVINYFYERHINERGINKVDFIDKIYETYNVFKFKDATWNAFNKILYSMNIYTENFYLDQFRTLSIVYHIIHSKEIPQTLEVDVITETRLHYIKGHLEKLADDEIELVYQFYMYLCINAMKKFEGKMINDDNKSDIHDTILAAVLILQRFKKTIKDMPNIIMKYVKLDWKTYEKHVFFRGTEKKKEISQDDLIRLLKQDTTLCLNKLSECKQSFDCSYEFRLTRLMKKLKVYFSNDIATDCLDMLEQWLLNKGDLRHIEYDIVICSILQIANEEYKINFMSKYAPVESKIAHNTIDPVLLNIQKGICRFVHYSRPPVPLQAVLRYIKGDYVHFCLPMFGAYFANLPKPLTVQFVSAIIDSAVSIQKHGLRLAFKCFSTDDLKKLILDIWKKTKNVSLRVIIYKALFEYLAGYAQTDIYEVLKSLTLDLHEDDQDEIFALLSNVSKIPHQFRKDFLKISWKTVSKFPERSSKNTDRKKKVIANMVSNIETMDKEFCRTEILDEFVHFMLFEKNIRPTYENYEVRSLINEKWNLVVKYILNFSSSEQFNKSWELASTIIKKCIEMWDTVHDNIFTLRKFLKSFLRDIILQSYYDRDKTSAIPMLQNIINLVEGSLPIRKMWYLLYLEFHLLIMLKGSWSEDNFSEDVFGAIISEKLTTFLLELKDKQMLYSCFYRELAEMISDVINRMTYSFEVSMKGDLLVLHVCNYMTNTQCNEIFMIALLMLPSKTEEQSKVSVWLSVINKAKQFQDDQISSLVWHKFMSDGESS